MTSDDLLALAERCERAAGEDGDLDEAIAEVVGFRRLGSDFGTMVGHWVSPDDWDAKRTWGVWSSHPGCPDFTGSLDAAMTLVPEGFYWSVDTRSVAIITPETPPHELWWGCRGARTPPLALCAAALRARATPAPEPLAEIERLGG